jgi:hypothetical protein
MLRPSTTLTRPCMRLPSWLSVAQRRPVLASAVVVVLGLLLSVTAFLLLLALEHMPDLPSR